MTKQEKLDALVAAIATNARTFDGVLSRCPVSKRSIMALMKSPENRAYVEAHASVELTYHASRGYVASGNGAFGYARSNDRRGGHSGAKVFMKRLQNEN